MNTIHDEKSARAAAINILIDKWVKKRTYEIMKENQQRASIKKVSKVWKNESNKAA